MGRTSIQLTDEQKDAVEAYQELLKEKNGYAPSQGETVKMACEKAAEANGAEA